VEVAGKPLVRWCLEAFAAAPGVERAVIAAPLGREAELASLAPERLAATAVVGGATRAESVGRALELVDTELVVVHDAARPLLTPALIETLLARLDSDPEATGVIAAAPLTETVKRVGDDQVIERTESRAQLWAAQTPQVFPTEVLLAVHAADPERASATDDAMLVERAGGRVLVEPAPGPNLKVTTPDDLRFAALVLGDRHRESN